MIDITAEARRLLWDFSSLATPLWDRVPPAEDFCWGQLHQRQQPGVHGKLTWKTAGCRLLSVVCCWLSVLWCFSSTMLYDFCELCQLLSKVWKRSLNWRTTSGSTTQVTGVLKSFHLLSTGPLLSLPVAPFSTTLLLGTWRSTSKYWAEDRRARRGSLAAYIRHVIAI